ncbi:MAG: glycosyl transferase group 1, partial [uncultured bacterium]
FVFFNFDIYLMYMKIGINASFLRKQNTGIGQVSANFLKELVEFSSTKLQIANNKEFEFVLYLEEDTDLGLLGDIAFSKVKFQKKVFLPKHYKRDDLFRKIWWEKVLLPKKVNQDDCDVLLSLYQCPTSLNKNKKKIKHIMIVHDIIPKLFPTYLNNWRKKAYQRLTEKAISKADKIIAVSHRTEKDLIQHLGIDAGKITVSYIDVDEIYKKDVSEKESARVLKKYKLEKGYIYNGGGLEVRKNSEGVLRAYKILLDEYGYTGKIPKLVVSGKMMPELAPLVTDVAQLVEGLDLQKHVVLLDYVPQEDLPALYRNSKFFVYPSLYEGFGLPVLEAMNQAVPTITSKTSSLPEVGVDAVLYCNPHSVDDLAMVMKNMIMNDHLQAALSLKAKERASHFSWDKFIEKILNVV